VQILKYNFGLRWLYIQILTLPNNCSWSDSCLHLQRIQDMGLNTQTIWCITILFQ